MIRLSDGTREQLCLETFYLARDNVPYCAVKERTVSRPFSAGAVL